MQWSEITAAPERRVLRQFAGLCLTIGVGVAAWRVSQGAVDWKTYAFGGLGLGVGLPGLAWPSAIRWVYSGWMMAVFPIGWTISRLIVTLMFYVLFTPVAVFFRLTGRDALHLRRPRQQTCWVPTRRPDPREYLRQY